MNLDELLKQIAPLPHLPEEWDATCGRDEARANRIYRCHAANTLPRLVAALMEIEAHHVEQNRLKFRQEYRSKTLAIVRAALAEAQEVKL